MKSTVITPLMVAIVAALAGCSGSSGGDGSINYAALPEVPADPDATPPTSPDPAEPQDPMDDESDEPQDSTTDPTDRTDPTDPLAPDSPSVSLDSLVGTVNFNYKFSFSSFQFSDTFTFTGESRIVENGVERLRTRDATNQYQCEISENRFYCNIISLNTSSVNNFLFTIESDGVGVGTYEFCSSITSSANCVSELLADPDGAVDVMVTAASGAALADASVTSEDTEVYKLLDEQADGPGLVGNHAHGGDGLLQGMESGLRAVHVK